MSSDLDFFFEGEVVGYFEALAYPNQDGTYRYMPYRGEGHYSLMSALQTSSGHRCYFDQADQRFFFTVVGHSGYGALELAEFDTPPAPRPAGAVDFLNARQP